MIFATIDTPPPTEFPPGGPLIDPNGYPGWGSSVSGEGSGSGALYDADGQVIMSMTCTAQYTWTAYFVQGGFTTIALDVDSVTTTETPSSPMPSGNAYFFFNIGVPHPSDTPRYYWDVYRGGIGVWSRAVAIVVPDGAYVEQSLNGVIVGQRPVAVLNGKNNWYIPFNTPPEIPFLDESPLTISSLGSYMAGGGNVYGTLYLDDAQIVHYAYDFGDGTTGETTEPASFPHEYDDGEYVTTLTVTDGYGATDTITKVRRAYTSTRKHGAAMCPASGVLVEVKKDQTIRTQDFNDDGDSDDEYETSLQDSLVWGRSFDVGRAPSPIDLTNFKYNYGEPQLFTIPGRIEVWRVLRLNYDFGGSAFGLAWILEHSDDDGKSWRGAKNLWSPANGYTFNMLPTYIRAVACGTPDGTLATAAIHNATKEVRFKVSFNGGTTWDERPSPGGDGEFISLFAATDGSSRIFLFNGEVWRKYSDDYGAEWFDLEEPDESE